VIIHWAGMQGEQGAGSAKLGLGLTSLGEREVSER
jgi:hypothetical protein